MMVYSVCISLKYILADKSKNVKKVVYKFRNIKIIGNIYQFYVWNFLIAWKKNVISKISTYVRQFYLYTIKKCCVIIR